MLRLLQWLRVLRMFIRHWPLAPVRVPDWTGQDAAALAHWLSKATGQKLLLLLRYHEQATNAGAVARMDHHEYACGYAAGFRSCAAWIHTLSDIVPPQADEPVQLRPRGAEDLVESYAP